MITIFEVCGWGNIEETCLDAWRENVCSRSSSGDEHDEENYHPEATDRTRQWKVRFDPVICMEKWRLHNFSGKRAAKRNNNVLQCIKIVPYESINVPSTEYTIGQIKKGPYNKADFKKHVWITLSISMENHWRHLRFVRSRNLRSMNISVNWNFSHSILSSVFTTDLPVNQNGSGLATV